MKCCASRGTGLAHVRRGITWAVVSGVNDAVGAFLLREFWRLSWCTSGRWGSSTGRIDRGTRHLRGIDGSWWLRGIGEFVDLIEHSLDRGWEIVIVLLRDDG